MSPALPSGLMAALKFLRGALFCGAAGDSFLT
jgi:hypothetical protein